VNEHRDEEDRSDFHYAALENDLERARELIDTGVDVDAADRDGFTPLHFAAQQGAVDVARLLLNRGAAVDPANRHGNTPLFTAVFNSKGEGALIELLCSAGADALLVNNHGQTPAGLARLIGSHDVAQFLGDVAG